MILSQNWLTATSDYAAISQVFNFSTSMDHQVIPVNIVNDDLVETYEVFSASLSLVSPAADTRVQLQPNSTEVTITNDDSKYCY
jgi:hypothetical protein